MIRSPLRLFAVPVMLAALLVGSGFAFAGDSNPPTTDTSTFTQAKRIEHSETVALREAREQAEAEAEAEYIAWAVAEEKRRADEALLAYAVEVERQAHEAWHDEQDRIAAEKRAAQATSAVVAPSGPVQGPEMGSGRCGGDLPPCYVMQRESGGDIRIWNGGCYAPVGHRGMSPCGTSSASGKWQFVRGTWNGYGGYVNAADAPESVQDAKARELWAGGRGCSHWAAC